MSDYYDKEMLHIEKERNRLLERIAGRLDDIRFEVMQTRTLLLKLPLNRLLIPMVDDDGDSKRVNSALKVKPIKPCKTIEELADEWKKKEENANG